MELAFESLTLYQTKKLLKVTKLEAFADDILNIVKMVITLSDRVENTVGQGKNAGYQHFLFPQCFPKPFSLGLLKVGIVWLKVKGGCLDFSHLIELKNIYIN